MVNKVMLIGRIGTAPEYKSDKHPVTFSLATWKNIKDESAENGWKSITTWHNIVAWGNPSVKEIISNYQVGSYVYIEGEIDENVFTNESGEKKRNIRINAFTVKKLNTATSDKKSADTSKPKPTAAAPKVEEEDDDFPF